MPHKPPKDPGIPRHPPRRDKDMANDPLNPEPNVLIKLGSALVHAEEWAETDELTDLEALRMLLADPEVIEWREQMTAMALLPVKRDG